MKNSYEIIPTSAKISALNCIDLSSPDTKTPVALLKQACIDSGFFYVINHGISQEFMDEVFAQSKKFFELPIQEKMKLLRNEKHRGYTPMLDEHLDPVNQIHGQYFISAISNELHLFSLVYLDFLLSGITLESNLLSCYWISFGYSPNMFRVGSLNPRPSLRGTILLPLDHNTGDYKEGYYIGIELPKDDSEAERQFYGPNIWPSEDILPGWSKTMEKYHQEALKVTKAIARVIALALDLDADFFEQPEYLGKPIATLRLLHYEGKYSDPTKGIFGAGAHTDYGLITLLALDDKYGLQICKNKDANPQVWEYVPPLKGAFVVNLGDMLERWSNLKFRSTLHRVLGNGQERYSIPFFVEPSHDCIVECLPTCQSKDNPPKFPPIKCEKYLLQRYMDTHAVLNAYK
nr:2-oxoglutarate-Fe(II) type oxidoreductase isoform X1 [Ipomoea trifida]